MSNFPISDSLPSEGSYSEIPRPLSDKLYDYSEFFLYNQLSPDCGDCLGLHIGTQPNDTQSGHKNQGNEMVSEDSMESQEDESPSADYEYSHSSSSGEAGRDQAVKARGRRVGTKGKMKHICKTRNLLVAFKKAHLKVLEKKLGPSVYEHPLVREIKKKNGISMTDYRNLYAEPSFRPAFKEYFRNRKIYRDMQNSRIYLTTRLSYMNKLHVFARAFETGVFNHIN